MKTPIRTLVVTVTVLALASPATAREELSLDGEWAFRLLAHESDAEGQTFWKPDAEVSGWGRIAVPSSWEMRGFGKPRYDDDISGESGLYRRTFAVPRTWPGGGRLFLRFEGVQFGAHVWVNGASAGDFTSSFNANEIEVTDLVRRDGGNVIAVRTHGKPLGAQFDTNDDWVLHGIFRGVALVRRPVPFVADWRLTTRLEGADARVAVRSRLDGKGTVSYALYGPDGARVAAADGAAAEMRIRNAVLWTAETPDLHVLEITVRGADGAVSETLREKVGLKEVTWSGRMLKVNGRPVKLRGVNHHDLSPVNGRAVTDREQRRDAELIKAANCNLIRTSHYPPSRALLDACDELGVYVIDEVPFGFGDEALEDPACGPILAERVRLTLARDANRASVIAWNVGNENPVTEQTRAAGRLVKELDPSRPWSFPMQPHYFVRHLETHPASDVGDLVNWHYPTIFGEYGELSRKWLGGFDRPYLFGEYAHAYGVESGLLERYWDSMWGDGACAGGAVWMFQDQGILRPADDVPPDDREALVWPAEDRVWDSHGIRGTDGIVYADRTPQSDYFEVRKVYAPVRVRSGGLAFRPGARNEWRLELENRYDHLSLEKGLEGRWSVTADGREIAGGAIDVPAVAPHAFGELTIAADVPETAAAVCALELRFADRRTHRAVSERAFPLVCDLPPPKERCRAEFDSARGCLRIVSASGRVLVESPFLAHVDRRRMLAKDLTTWRDDPWLPCDVEPKAWRVLCDEPGRLEVDVTWCPTNAAPDLTEKGTYDPPQDQVDAIRVRELRGRIIVESPGDRVRVSYEMSFASPRKVTELGLGFRTASGCRRVDWVGLGPYECYPECAMLSEFGCWALDVDDLNFTGNRREVRRAVVSSADGAGTAFAAERPSDFVFGRCGGRIVLSHAAIVSGKGGKFKAPLGRRTLKAGEPVRGGFEIFAAEGSAERLRPFAPFVRSYDR